MVIFYVLLSPLEGVATDRGMFFFSLNKILYSYTVSVIINIYVYYLLEKILHHESLF